MPIRVPKGVVRGAILGLACLGAALGALAGSEREAAKPLAPVLAAERTVLALPPPDPLQPTPLARMPSPPEAPASFAFARPSTLREPAAWQQHGVPVAAAEGRPRIVVVIDDLGLNRPATRRTLALPGPLTLSFMTYADGLADFSEAAGAAGHEVMLHLPMEPSNHLDPGPRALLLSDAKAKQRANLRWSLDRLEGYVGVNNHMGSAFTADEPGMRLVMAELRRRGLLFLDSRTSAETKGPILAEELGVPLAERHVFLDHEVSRDFIRQQLAETESIARRDGVAIAIGHPYAETLDALAAWLPDLAERGFQLVPVSAVVRVESEETPPRLIAVPGAG